MTIKEGLAAAAANGRVYAKAKTIDYALERERGKESARGEGQRRRDRTGEKERGRENACFAVR